MRDEKTERKKYVLNVDFTKNYGEDFNRHKLHLNKYEAEACDSYDPFKYKIPEDGGPIFLSKAMPKAILVRSIYWFWNKREITGIQFCKLCQKKPRWDLET